MSVPKFHELALPLLQAAAVTGAETRIADLEDGIAKTLNLTDAELSQTLPSGKQTVFSNRLNWAKSYMGKAGLVASTRRGHFKVTDRGLALLAEKPDKITLSTFARYPEFVTWKSLQTSANGTDEINAVIAELDPEESIAVHFQQLNHELSEELIERVHNFTPAFFERLIIDLLLAMGYGGGRVEMSKALGRSGDGGVDGVIREDELGLDVVYVQAKRYAPSNGVPIREVRDFVGSLEGHRAAKGVFVTTSYFPESAREFIERVSKRIILIDGAELARLMIRHKVGVRIRDTYEVKKIDEDYFVE